MNNKDYLNKIASENRPLSQPAPGFFGSKLNLSMKQLKILGIVAGAIFLVMIIAMIATSGNKNSERDYVDQAYLRATNLEKVIVEHNKKLKSSELRSIATSLVSILSENSFILATSLTEDFGAKGVGEPEKKSLLEDEEAHRAELNDTLEAGRLNGLLDRVFAREFAYQTSMLISLEENIIARTKKENLKSKLTTSIANLEQVRDRFDSFEAK